MKRRLALAAIASVAVALLWLGWRAWWLGLRADVGEPTAALDDTWHDAPRIVDRRGVVLRDVPTDHTRRGQPLAIEDIGHRLLTATLVSEDADFYAHDGVDGLAILRAAEQNIRHARFVSGASTITQQLVKLLDTRGVPSERGLALKLREAARAQNLEQVLDKETILVEYCNRLPYGNGLIGPQAAAQSMFGVASRDLSWAQAALLAVLPRAPSALDPYVHLERARLRQRALLAALHEAGEIDQDALARALDEPIELREIVHPFEAPHFVDALLAADAIAPRGTTRTTIDLRLQHDVEGLVATHLAAIVEQGGHNAGVIVVDNDSGEVLSWVGSADYDSVEIDGQVDMVRARRQPGSTLKPFVFAAGLMRGHSPHELAADVPTEFAEHMGSTYSPGNFHGGHTGPIPLREALAASLNVPFVRLASDVGPRALLELLHALGFASLDRSADHYGLSLALGTGEVSLRELATAYVALARGGEAIGLRTVIDDEEASTRRVLPAAVAASVTDALSDPRARLRLLEGRSPFDIGFPLAVKTGTSSGYRDAWAVGYTAERTVAVWVGNADGTATRGLTGAGGAGPLFADVMRRTMLEVPTRRALLAHDALVPVEVCSLSGERPGAQCPDRVQRSFAADAVPERACTLHVAATRAGKTDGGRSRWRCGGGDATDTVVRLPAEFSAWLATLPDGAPGQDAHDLSWVAHDLVEGCTEASGQAARIVITSPVIGAVWPAGTPTAPNVVEIAARVDASLDVHRLELVVDGEVVATVRAPFVARVDLAPGDHEVYARPADDRRGGVSERVAFAVR